MDYEFKANDLLLKAIDKAKRETEALNAILLNPVRAYECMKALEGIDDLSSIQVNV